MRISDWSSDVCSSDLAHGQVPGVDGVVDLQRAGARRGLPGVVVELGDGDRAAARPCLQSLDLAREIADQVAAGNPGRQCQPRSEEHTSELQSLMRISYAVFCLKKKKKT